MNGYFFGLQQLPFAAVPDTEAYFSTQQMETARQSIERTVRRGDGISLVIGSSGVGKTLLLRLLRKKLESEFTVASISNGKLNCPKDFLRQLAFELRLPVGTSSGSVSSGNISSENDELQYRFALTEFARQEPTQGIVLLIDEAQYLDNSVLEEIRLLMNTDDGTKPFFRVVLAGTLEFEEKLTLTQFASFDQRVAARIYLDTLTLDETIRYIDQQSAAGAGVTETGIAEQSEALEEYTAFSGKDNGSGNSTENDSWGEVRRFDSAHCRQSNTAGSDTVFTIEAKRLVYRYSEGLPRIINQICRSAMELALLHNDEQISGQTVQTVRDSILHIEGNTEGIKPVEVKQEVSAAFSADDEKYIEQKKKTLQLKEFDSVIEFGSLEDDTLEDNIPESGAGAEDVPSEIAVSEIISETVLPQTAVAEPITEEQVIDNRAAEQYKPPYPMDFEEEAFETAEEVHCKEQDSTGGTVCTEDDFLENNFDITQSSLFRKPVRTKNYCWDGKRKYQKRNLSANKNKVKPEAVAEHFASLFLLGREFNTKTAWAGNVSGRNLFYPVRCCSFVSVKSSDGIIGGIAHLDSGSNMDTETLKKYSEEILNDRPLFVRREPHYAYQITDSMPLVSSALPIVWQTPEPADGAGIATAYRDFAERQTELNIKEEIHSEEGSAAKVETAKVVNETLNPPEVVRFSFAASESGTFTFDMPAAAVEGFRLSIDEDFDETVEVALQPVAASVIFAADKEKKENDLPETPAGRDNSESVALVVPFQQDSLIRKDSPHSEYIITQQALEAVVQRITEAAEIIEQAADVSKEAGTQISEAADISKESVIKFRQTADWVQEEVKAVIPNYKEVFQELSEFQETVSSEMRRIKTDHRRISETMRSVQPFMKESIFLSTGNTFSNADDISKTLPFPKRSGFVPNPDAAEKEFAVKKKSAEFKVSE